MSYKNEDGSVKATSGIGTFKKGRVSFKRLLKMVKHASNNYPVELENYNRGNIMENEKKASIGPVELQKSDYLEKEANQVIDTAMEKDAAFFDAALTNGFKRGLGAAAGGAVIGALGMAGNYVLDKMQEQKYLSCLQQAIRLSPALQRYDMETLRSYLPMIVKASPTVANDPRLLANYLESMLDAEGHLNLGTFRELASLENTVLSNREMANPTLGAFRKGLSEGMGKSMGKILSYR